MKPLLLIGGYGVAGRQAARLFRARHPDFPMTIAGRHLSTAEAFCRELGGARALRTELQEPGLGLSHAEFSGVVVYAKDAGLHGLDFAGRHGLPYLGLSSAAFELAPDLAHGLVAGRRAPVVLAGNWFGGAAMMAALALAERFGAVDAITLAIVVEPDESGSGPASISDFERISISCHTQLIRARGSYSWAAADDERFRRADGLEVPGSLAVSPDAAGLGAATRAREVRVLENWGPSSSSAGGGPRSDEIVVEISGTDRQGRPLELRQCIIGRHGGTPLTALATAILTERLLGLDGADPPPPGLYTPEVLLAPSSFTAAMREAGIVFEGP